MDDLFFYASKLIWMFISPDILIILLMILATGLLYTRHLVLARRLFSLLTLILLAITILPLGQWLMYPLETRFQTNPPLPGQVDGIIVLGGSVMPILSEEWGQLQTNSSQERLRAGVELAQRYPDAQVIFSGGSASIIPGRPTEAQMVRDFFIDAGITPDRLLLESRSRTTAENAHNINELVRPQRGETWLLVTTAYHLPRSVALFCKLDWSVLPYPVDHITLPTRLWQPTFNFKDHLPILVAATHEWTGLGAYYLSGRIDSIFPGECRV